MDGQHAAAFRLPRWSELPAFDLYMDQVLSIVEKHIAPFADEGDAAGVITKTMINNYVKLKLLSAPVSKKYSRPQLAFLIIVSILKRVFGIGELTDIKAIVLKTMPPQQAYDCFCDELEASMRAVFLPSEEKAGPAAAADEPYREERLVIRAMAFAYANKAYAQRLLSDSKRKSGLHV